MRSFKYLLPVLLLVFTTVNLSAQSNLLKWVAKCESLKDVETTVINRNNPDTRQLERTTTKIVFSDNESLLNELFTAFDNDKSSTTKYAEKKENEKILPSNCRFFDKIQKTDTRFVFHFDVGGRNFVLVTVRYNYEE
ncbi:DUF5024 domain-containing protein [Dysgonomonas termitidis]|uniref:DUF5024 domain-containing protein n=1 Tax=Dysgonomonas termitidis TaxID=1516126 RepID=A0ABV9KUL4_9BACT